MFQPFLSQKFKSDPASAIQFKQIHKDTEFE